MRLVKRIKRMLGLFLINHFLGGTHFFDTKRTWFKPFYPFAVIFVFFIMRGDMLSSFSYLVGFFAAYCVVLTTVRVSTPAIERSSDRSDGDLS